eukprot:scpid43524/ scgid7377/ 
MPRGNQWAATRSEAVQRSVGIGRPQLAQNGAQRGRATVTLPPIVPGTSDHVTLDANNYIRGRHGLSRSTTGSEIGGRHTANRSSVATRNSAKSQASSRAANSASGPLSSLSPGQFDWLRDFEGLLHNHDGLGPCCHDGSGLGFTAKSCSSVTRNGDSRFSSSSTTSRSNSSNISRNSSHESSGSRSGIRVSNRSTGVSSGNSISENRSHFTSSSRYRGNEHSSITHIDTMGEDQDQEDDANSTAITASSNTSGNTATSTRGSTRHSQTPVGWARVFGPGMDGRENGVLSPAPIPHTHPTKQCTSVLAVDHRKPPIHWNKFAQWKDAMGVFPGPPSLAERQCVNPYILPPAPKHATLTSATLMTDSELLQYTRKLGCNDELTSSTTESDVDMGKAAHSHTTGPGPEERIDNWQALVESGYAHVCDRTAKDFDVFSAKRWSTALSLAFAIPGQVARLMESDRWKLALDLTGSEIPVQAAEEFIPVAVQAWKDTAVAAQSSMAGPVKCQPAARGSMASRWLWGKMITYVKTVRAVMWLMRQDEKRQGNKDIGVNHRPTSAKKLKRNGKKHKRKKGNIREKDVTGKKIATDAIPDSTSTIGHQWRQASALATELSKRVTATHIPSARQRWMAAYDLVLHGVPYQAQTEENFPTVPQVHRRAYDIATGLLFTHFFLPSARGLRSNARDNNGDIHSHEEKKASSVKQAHTLGNAATKSQPAKVPMECSGSKRHSRVLSSPRICSKSPCTRKAPVTISRPPETVPEDIESKLANFHYARPEPGLRSRHCPGTHTLRLEHVEHGYP